MSDYYENVNINAAAQAEENRLVNRALTKLPAPYISGLKLEGGISINGLALNTIDSNGVVWVVTEIDGWWTLPEPELPDLPRGWGDGSYDAVGRYANRLITLNGSFLPQDPSDASAARAALMQAVNLVKTGGWLVVDEDPSSEFPRAAYVRLSGVPQITSVNARGRHDFSVGLKAVDPTKYEYVDGAFDGYRAATIASGGNITVTNHGNVPVPVVFEITGALAGVSSSSPATIFLGNTAGTDPTIKIIGTTTSAQTLEIDTYNREVLLVEGNTVLNGRSKAAVLVDWIYLQPGQNKLNFRDPSVGTTASCRVLWRSGWIS